MGSSKFLKIKKLIVSPKFQKSQIFRDPPKFRIFTKIEDPLFWNSRELWSTQRVKMQEYMCFPKFSRWKIRFFPEKCRPQFLVFVEIGAPPFLKFPGIVITTTCKNAKIYGFPEILETQFRLFPEKCRPKFLVFTKIWGQHFREFPGILVDKITKNARIYGFLWILEINLRFFPGNFYEIPKSPIFLNFRKPRNFGERVTSTERPQIFNFHRVFH